VDLGGELGSMGCALGIVDNRPYRPCKWSVRMTTHIVRGADVVESLIHVELSGGETIIMAILQDSIDTVQM